MGEERGRDGRAMRKQWASNGREAKSTKDAFVVARTSWRLGTLGELFYFLVEAKRKF